MGKKTRRWVMPGWMAPYVEHFSDTGGWMKPEDAMNCEQSDCNFVVNSPRAALCVAVSAQTRLLLRLHKEGLLGGVQ